MATLSPWILRRSLVFLGNVTEGDAAEFDSGRAVEGERKAL